MRQCLNCFGTKRTHSSVPGLKVEALFLELLVFFIVSADCRLVQIHILICIIQTCIHVKLYKKQILHIQINVYKFLYTNSYMQNCTRKQIYI
jgi:hypothetical protein